MLPLQKKNHEKIILAFFYFISLQPIIDVLTTFTIVQLHSSATVGIVIRMIYMLASLLFMASFYKKVPFAKWATIYVVIWGIFVLGNLGINFSQKPNFALFDEIKFFIKISYFNIVLLNFIFIYKYFSNKDSLFKFFLRNIVWSALIIGLVMLISILTGTSLKSYQWTKIGFTGWFFAGNEIGAILAIILPIVTYFAIIRTNNIQTSYYWIPVLLSGFSLIMLGTKVGLGALFITLFMGLLSVVVAMFRKKMPTANLKLNALVLFFLIVVIAISTPFTPVYKNTYSHMELIGMDTDKADDPQPKTKEEKKKEKEKSKKQVESLILSSRDIYLNKYKKYYQSSPVSQKIMGMGYAGNYKKEAKMIEMDYFDIFYSTGPIGTILYFFPLVFLFIYSAVWALKHLADVFLPKNTMLISSIVLGLGIANFAGHVYTAPAVSIYLAVIIAYFYYDIKSTSKIKI
ncbi:hypothetical protein J2S13_001658 [Oikeobacillus pervagus]|uniref:O-antigen ligase like membrane protein n=1 Tax=Oikeobacillus pervagus TaxID=1325931 RepID=A0AAJ1SYQ0_9BACI|nr:O-antigen ligase family protein [Oikeobacillus pervagus]MDQ0215258.1 hypothetical protein [Oikeobacillus pervagus]